MRRRKLDCDDDACGTPADSLPRDFLAIPAAQPDDMPSFEQSCHSWCQAARVETQSYAGMINRGAKLFAFVDVAKDECFHATFVARMQSP
jgi:hypothetical protein